MIKKPMLRHLQATFGKGSYLDLYAVDVGGDSHGFSGNLVADGVVLQQVTGNLKGIEFIDPKPNKGGRPRNTEKYIAFALAESFYSLKCNSRTEARNMVAAAFHYSNHQGDGRDVRKAINKVKHLLSGHILLTYVGDEGGGCCIALKNRDALKVTDQRLQINVEGWFWFEGEKQARYGKMSCDTEGNFDPHVLNALIGG